MSKDQTKQESTEVPKSLEETQKPMEEEAKEPVPSLEDSIKKYDDVAYYRYNVIAVLAHGFSAMIAEHAKNNDLLQEQNELLKGEKEE